MIQEQQRLGRLILAAAVVGALGAAAAIAVRVILREGFELLYGSEDVTSGLAALPAWQRILAPALGGLAAGLLVSLLVPRVSAGVADVMESVALGRGRPRLDAAGAQAAGTIAAQLGGGSLGREGPLIMLGAGIGQTVGERVTPSTLERRALVAAGTAAGFAAAYNTPIAAVLFVIEVVVGVATLDVIVPVAVATAVGTALTRVVIGGGPIYGARTFELVSSAEFLAFGLLGVLAAVAGVAFMKLLAAGESVFARARAWPRAVRAALGGLAVGLIAWRIPDVTGNGYEPVRAILDGKVALGALLLLVAAKALATTFSVGSGSPGGVFTPTMLIGAALGAALGAAILRVAPGSEVVPGGYALVGLAAALAATTHAPLMATVLGFELSGDYAIVLPLLLATAVATMLSRALQRDSIYTAELRRRGIPWEGSVAERIAHAVRARDLLEVEIEVAAADEPLAAVLDRLAKSRARLLYVVSDGPLRAISLTAAKSFWAAARRGEALPATAGDVATPVATIRLDDSAVAIGQTLASVDWGELPVIDPDAPSRPVGVVTRRGLLAAFDRELLQQDMRIARVMSDGHRVAVVPVPERLVGQSLDAASLGVIVLHPDPGHVLTANDRLTVIATPDELARLS